jgi:hypothetical protein
MTKQDSRAYLREMLKPGDKLVMFMPHVSRSGMTRHFIVFIQNEKGLMPVSYEINALLEYKAPKYNGYERVKVGGCGMDMSFWLAYTITNLLYDKEESEPEGLLTGNGGNCLPWQVIY